MERPKSDSTSTQAWMSDGWRFESVNVAGLGNWEIVPLALAGLVIISVPPTPTIDYRSSEESALTDTSGGSHDEDVEDLADGLATLEKYKARGASAFVKYSDYTKQRTAES